MSMDVLDFRDRGNFDFFKFTKYADETDRNFFVHDCEKILEYSHQTVRDVCLLGLRLSDLKKTGTWRNVYDPEAGISFDYDRFCDFCVYAFGFSKTRTSNLLGLAEFVKLNGENVDLIDRTYSEYTVSQLVELSSVSGVNRKFFSPAMTVSEMRTLKNYLRTGVYDSTWTPEQALASAKEYYAEKTQERSVIPEDSTQPNIFNPERDVETSREHERAIPSEASEPPKSESIDWSERDKHYVPDVDRVLTGEKPEYNLTTRDGRRKWMADYTHWALIYVSQYPLCESVYCYNLKGAGTVYASETRICVDAEKLTSYTVARLYLRRDEELPLQLSKEQLEKYLSSHAEEL